MRNATGPNPAGATGGASALASAPASASPALRILALFFILAAGIMLIATAPQRVLQLRAVAHSSEFALTTLGLTTEAVPIVVAVSDAVMCLTYFAVAIVILLRRSSDQLALLSAVMLACMSAAIVRPNEAVRSVTDPVVRVLYLVVLSVGILSVSTFLHLFPSTRFIPRWTGWLAAFWGVLIVGFRLVPPFVWPPRFGPIWATAIWVLSGLAVHIYRYRRQSTTVQRQQTKWIVLGLAVAVLGFVGFNFVVPVLLPAVFSPGVARMLYVLVGVPLEYAALMALPLAFAFSILRYRLWDVDRIATRAVVYAAMTGGLVALYFGCVLLLQQLFRNIIGDTSVLAIVISTIAIALLFNPLRQRAQAAIDRRTYRRKYDAALTLQRFGEIARDEVDLDVLTRELISAANETMQTQHASVWLKKR